MKLSGRYHQSMLIAIALLLSALIGSMVVLPDHPNASSSAAEAAYIVQASDVTAAAAAVEQAGGDVTRHLSIINGVSATLDATALAQLQSNPNVVINADAVVEVAKKGKKDKDKDDDEADTQAETDTEGNYLYPSAATGVDQLHQTEVTTRQTACVDGSVTVTDATVSHPLRGRGVTVAVIDSGFMKFQRASAWKDGDRDTLFAENDGRCFIYRDFTPRTRANGNNNKNNSADTNGHGTHVLSTIADNREATLVTGATDVAPIGVAPEVNLMIARALDHEGAGTYGDVIEAIEWIVENKDRYNVRVLNLSLYAPVTGPYWADPLNQAVMQAWQAGIVVVAAAGNQGPEAATITVPGNVPYVITVGAIRSGRYTESGEDELANYSSRGPTESAFIKPDVLVPATRTIAPIPDGSTLADLIDTWIDSGDAPAEARYEEADVDYGIDRPDKKHTYYQLSGTSMAAAEVSGFVALMLQANPDLTNDEVKYQLMATARPAIDTETGDPAYSPWEQGAGLIDADAAVFSAETGAANAGMDIALDLQVFDDGREEMHYWGYTGWDEETGEFRLIDPETGEMLAIWDGGGKSWAGGGKSWAGGGKSWAGGGKSWAGGGKSWAGGGKSWAGNDRVWINAEPATLSNSATDIDLLITDVDPLPGPTETPTPEPTITPEPTEPVRPVLECVEKQRGNRYTAYFGYLNENEASVTIPVGSANRFHPDAEDRGQPETFAPGRQVAAFTVDFNGGNLVWLLDGRTATATKHSERCR
jgi:hypothetical protein